MKITNILLASFLLISSFSGFAAEIPAENDKDKTEKIFTSKDKDFLQQWHYKEVLKMDLDEKELQTYFTVLNSFTYKMSRLGLPQYEYTDVERNKKFDELSNKLDATMKDILSPSNFSIHQESFDTIKEIVYEKRNWKE